MSTGYGGSSGVRCYYLYGREVGKSRLDYLGHWARWKIGHIIRAESLGYLTDSTDFVVEEVIQHGDNHQAALSTSFFPLELNDDRIGSVSTCPATIKVSWVTKPHTVTRCTCSTLQTCKLAKKASTIEFTFWQRTDNLYPTLNAGTILDCKVAVNVDFGDDGSYDFQWVANITLATNASNGSYGTITPPGGDAERGYGAFVDDKLKIYIGTQNALFNLRLCHDWDF
ncbi:uncharacterized protein A1O5_10606 [Cladophialophora psammophila CBS 110553]|uniref:Uncharacterized protein n=1 Tax=Cladophialophora psammophila CBS 110553 TaxID=1182543 RepID=W9X7N1_9EURO|nr:uncharacterized protein A1O5_10606 [Cladophialophora psammophila CBS 110553]EXJ66454.1 hypothetical protein A1O5_10606 [Cladophialophora psammophila CBS 110553]